MTTELFRIREQILPFQIIQNYEEGRLDAMLTKCPALTRRVKELNQHVIELLSDYDTQCALYEGTLQTYNERCLFSESREALEIRYYTLKDEAYRYGYSNLFIDTS
jgi:hypothetical protein